MFKALKDTIAPGLSFTNDSEVPMLVVLSQLSPLHWMKVAAGNIVSSMKSFNITLNQFCFANFR